MPTIDLGSVVGPQGAQGNTGPQGEQGVAGPSLISASTQTTLTGVLAGDGSTVGVRAVDSTPTVNSNNLVSSDGVFTKITTDVANAYQRTCNPNLLDNWYFVGGGTGDDVFPVNQRGQTSYIGDGDTYGTKTIDRWSIREVNNTLVLSSDGVTASKGITATRCDFYQRFPTGMLSALQGKTVTATVWYANGFISGSFVWGSSASTVASNENITIYSGGATTQYTNFCIRVANSQKIYAAKLEIGDTQTLAHQENGVWVLNEIPNYQQELAKCQRYFIAISQMVSTPLAGIGVARNATAAILQVPLPVTMRGATATISKSGTIKLWHGSITTFADAPEVTAVSAVGIQSTGINFAASVASGLTAGELCQMQLESGAAIYVSVEL